MRARLKLLKRHVEDVTGFVFGYEQVRDYVQIMPSHVRLNEAYLAVFPGDAENAELATVIVGRHSLYFGRFK